MKPMRRMAIAYAKLRYGTTPEPLENWYPHGGVSSGRGRSWKQWRR